MGDIRPFSAKFFNYYYCVFVTTEILTVIYLQNVNKVKGPYSATLLFSFTCKSLAITFYLEHVEMKEITAKPLKIIKHTFKNNTYGKVIRFPLTIKAKFYAIG